ncbi:MAG: GNAT family N-acetyltransferase [Thermoanaerobaculaceae bacterium]|mgnify:CR=1 FL=1|nr:GNAT family N-acetyltransferase [Thermoanaerobaculaceae bacterium]MDI9621418.1 GNAT family N-acetyltransferase [Acidobacteriota bacterium]NLH10130.1 GNAT family N-acetyltransferase [Holophagae bacterium]
MHLEGFPQPVTLRDGTEVVIRPLCAIDGAELLEFYRAFTEEERQFLRDDVSSPEWLERFLKKVDFEEVVSLVAELDGAIVGETTLYRTRYGWTRHVGEIRVAVARDLRRKGLGIALSRAVVKLATNLGIEKMVVQVVENQVGARHTFEKLGFTQEATLRAHVKDIRGLKRDLLVLSNDVSHIWHAMEAMVADYSPMHE